MHKARLNKLLKDLKHTDASKRRLAAEALSEGDERAIYPLIKALKDNNFGVQDAAIRSLIELKDESTAYMVLPLLREDSYLRNTAIIILREMGKLSVPLLRGLLNDKDDDVRKFVLDLIYDIRYCDYPDDIIKVLSNDPNANVRSSAAKALGILKYVEALPDLLNSLHDEEWVCFSALDALSNIGDDVAVNPIIDLLDSPSETIRFAAIEALGNISSHKAQKPLEDQFSKVDGTEKQLILKSLLQIGSISSLHGVSDMLVDLLKNHDEWSDAAIALKGVGELKDKEAIFEVVSLAGNLDVSIPDNEDKIAIIKETLLSIGCNNELIKILRDGSINESSKVLAIEILGDLTCSEAVPVLINLLKSGQRDIRRSSVSSLGSILNDEAITYLKTAIKDPDSHVRKSAVIAIGKIKDGTAFEALMKMLHTEDYDDVIDAFINTLLKINPSMFLERINEFNDHIKTKIEQQATFLNIGAKC